MKRIIYLLIIGLGISIPCLSQWELIFTEDGSISRPGEFRDMHFSDSLNGIVIGDYYTGIIRTDDGGKTWNFDINSFRDDLYMLSFANKDTGLVIVTNNWAYFTNDGGKTFSQEQWTVPIIGDKQSYDYHMVNRKTIYTVGSKVKVTKTTNGGQSWIPCEEFNFSNSINDITCIDADTCFACGSVAKIIKTVDGGENWEQQEVLLNNNLYVINFIDSEYGFVGGQYGVLLKTEDGGDNWITLDSHLNYNIISIHFINKLDGYVINDAGKISKTIDGGVNWTTINPNDENLYSISKIYFKDSTTLFALQDNNIFKYDLSQNSTTDLDKIEKNRTVCIYPNPVKDYFMISDNGNLIDKLEVIDITGKTYITAEYNISEKIDLRGLKAGVYIVKLYSNNKVVIQKIIKL